MFGYIHPCRPEWLVREDEQYRGIYCTLCRTLGKRYGFFARMTLSYDMTFLALFLLDRAEDCPGFSRGKCFANPLKKCSYCQRGEKEFAVSAALTVILAYWKLRDDLADSGFLRRFGVRFKLMLGRRAYRKAAREYPKLSEIAKTAIEEQQKKEQEPEAGLDALCEPTAKLLSEIFSSVAGKSDTDRRVLSQFGFFLGRWIYLIDAVDDLQEDIKKGRFNPIVRAQESLSEPTSQYCKEILNHTLCRLMAAFNLLECGRFDPMIRNVVMLGLEDTQKQVLSGKFRKKVKEHV